MAKEFICNFSKQELEEIYSRPNMTLKKMCEIIGCKSDITMSKILKKNGIDTNHNQKLAYMKRGGRTDGEFKEYLIKEYSEKMRSMTSIAKELGISWVIVSRYLDKYEIPKRTKSEQQSGERSVGWKGGIHKKSNGYIEIYCPSHPNANKRKSVYEHQLVAEKKLGRYLKNGEVVHHIDMNKSNNAVDNLIVLTNQNHMKLHSLLKNGMSFQDAIKKVEVINE